ncbi:MAG: hypothetical protein HYS43_00630 [Candidatus Liptonbacteria bacterium]|nr:hypothetical protein [Candidatus Liptonbacteria bacterium]
MNKQYRQAAWKYIRMLVSPIAFGWILVGVWWFIIRRFGIVIGDQDGGVTAVVIGVLGVPYGVIVAFMLERVWREFDVIAEAVERKDLKTFLAYRDKRIPKTIYLLLGSLSVILVSWIMLIDYENAWAAVFALFTVGFIITLCWEIVMELDDPFRGVLRVDDVPDAWLTMSGSKTRKRGVRIRKPAA